MSTAGSRVRVSLGNVTAGLEPSETELRAFVECALEHVIAELGSVRERPASDLEGAAGLARTLVEPLPQNGEPYPGLLARLFQEWIPKSIHTASPGALSYVQGGGIVHAAVADFIALAVNRYVGYWAASPALAELEATVIRWFAELLGLPAQSAGGVLTSGGSMANLMAIVAARTERLGEDFRRARIYASDQVHHSIEKAARIAGLPRDVMCVVPSDERQRVQLAPLTAAIEADRRAGREPLMLVGTGGSTNTGAVDDLAGLAKIAAAQRLWFHVDAAYGGFFALTEHGRRRLHGIEHADSVVLDPHKSLFLPYGTGAILVRDVETLRRSHQLHSEYIEGVSSEGRQTPSFADLSPELSRDFRGLRVWLPLKMLGSRTFAAALDEKLELAAWAAAQLQTMREVELIDSPQLSTVAFRIAGDDAAVADARGRAVLDHVNRRARVHLSATVVRDRFVLRMCILSFRTHRRDVETCLEDLQRALVDTATLRAPDRVHGLGEPQP